MKGMTSVNILVALFLLLVIGVLMPIFQMASDSLASGSTSPSAILIASLIPTAIVISILWVTLKILNYAFQKQQQY